MPLRPMRPYQQETVDAVAARLSLSGAVDRRTHAVLMCGTGKTLVTQRAVERLIDDGTLPADGTIVLFFPSLALVQQTYDSWLTEPQHAFRGMAFCSGESRTAHGDDLGTDDLTLPRSTSVEDLADWLSKSVGSLNVVFATYQSSVRLAAIHRLATPLTQWDLIICDEAHRTTGRKDSSWSAPVDNILMPAAMRLFVTATPRVHVGGSAKAKAAGIDIISMDDTELFGERAYTYPMPQAVEDGFLSDYHVVIMGVTDTEIRKAMSASARLELKDLNDKQVSIRMNDVLTAIAVTKASKEYDLSRVLSFHSSIARAEHFRDVLTDFVPQLPDDVKHAPTVTALSIKGTDSQSERDLTIKRLAETRNDEWTVVTNCKVLSEGVDVPTLDAVMFADPRTSPVEVTQIVGRAIRLNPERPNQPSIVVIPVLDKEGVSDDDRLEDSSYKKVWQAIVALAEHDPRMEADLSAMRTWEAERLVNLMGVDTDDVSEPLVDVDTIINADAEPTDTPVGIESDDPDMSSPAAPVRTVRRAAEPPKLSKVSLSLSVHGEDAARTFMASFATKVVTHTVESWTTNLAALVMFRTRHDRWPNANRGRTERRLGNWIIDQRRAHVTGDLGTERTAMLDAQFPDWNLTFDDIWAARLTVMTDYRIEHDGRWPTKEATDEAEKSPGTWLNRQRAAARKGELSDERTASMDAHAPGWNLGDDGQWDVMLADLTVFRSTHARWPQNSGDDDSEREIARWLANQRQLGNRKTIEPARLAKLDNAVPGWLDWREREWTRNFVALKAYYLSHDKWPAAKSTDADVAQLSSWRKTQWSAAKRGALSAERIAALDEISTDWRFDFAVVWTKTLKSLIDFLETHHRLPSQATTDVAELRLRSWVGVQKNNLRIGSLSEERARRLDESAPGWKSSTKDLWGQNLDAMLAFIKEHQRFPTKSGILADEIRLHTWLTNQKSLHTSGTLNAERKTIFDDKLPGWDAAKKDAWRVRFDELVVFAETHGRIPTGSVDVEKDEFRASIWLSGQRGQARRGALSKGRLAELDAAVPGWNHAIQENWNSRLDQACAFVNEHGRFPTSSTSSPADEKHISVWIHSQKSLATRGILPPAREKELDSRVPGWNQNHDTRWADKLTDCIAFFGEHNRVPSKRAKDDAESALGLWLSTQRQVLRKGKMTAARLASLDAAGDWR